MEGLRKKMEGFAGWLMGKKIFESISIWHFYCSAIIEKVFGIYNHGLAVRVGKLSGRYYLPCGVMKKKKAALFGQPQ